MVDTKNNSLTKALCETTITQIVELSYIWLNEDTGKIWTKTQEKFERRQFI